MSGWVVLLLRVPVAVRVVILQSIRAAPRRLGSPALDSRRSPRTSSYTSSIFNIWHYQRHFQHRSPNRHNNFNRNTGRYHSAFYWCAMVFNCTTNVSDFVTQSYIYLRSSREPLLLFSCRKLRLHQHHSKPTPMLHYYRPYQQQHPYSNLVKRNNQLLDTFTARVLPDPIQSLSSGRWDISLK